MFVGGAGMMLAAPAFAVARAADFQGARPGRRSTVLDYGAVGDGRADDTDAVQKALDDTFLARHKGFLDIPPGVYRVSRTLRVAPPPGRDGNITQECGIFGHGAVLRSTIEDGSPVLAVDSRSTIRFVRIEGLQIQGNGREGHGLLITSEKRGAGFYNFCLRDVAVQGCGGDGCRLIGNVFEGQIFNAYFRDNKGNGATFGHGAEDTVLSSVHVFGCVFGGNGGQGAALINGAADVGFHGCYFLLNAMFGLVARNGCTLLSNCGFENNHARSPDFAHGDAGLLLKIFGTLVGCTAYSIYNQTHLVRAEIVHRLVMIGCTGAGGGRAKGAKLAKLDGTGGAGVTLIGCWGRAETTGHVQPVVIGRGAHFGSEWNDGNLAQLGEYRLWVDGSGRLRMKKGQPSADGDGSVVGA